MIQVTVNMSMVTAILLMVMYQHSEQFYSPKTYHTHTKTVMKH